jgi:hypothetical protein
MTWFRSNSDKVLITGLFLVLLFTVLRRVDYAGDGLRHLDHVLNARYPAVGEPRWILFPVLLFGLLKPFVVAGIIDTVRDAAKLFTVFNVAFALGYMMCLRRWLMELPGVQRSAVLLLASGSQVFLTLATDAIEPTPAVFVAVAGLTYARFHSGLTDTARLMSASVSIALASLIYQGLLLAFFFLPAIFSVSFLASRHAVFRIASMVVAPPLLTVAVLWAFDGETPVNAARRFVLVACIA